MLLRPWVVLSSCIPLAVHAQTDSPGSGPNEVITITATRTPQPVSRLVSDVTVVTREEIVQAGHSSLAQILQAQPGLQVFTNGGPGTAASVFVRGTNSGDVAVLVDGVRVNSLTAGSAAFEHIPPSQIDRIEIVRGPMTSLYGADAVGGVIQIFTRTGDGPVRPRFSAGYGSYQTEQYTAGVGGSAGDTSFDLNAGYFYSRSFSAVDDPTSPSFNSDADSYRNLSFSGRLAHHLSPDHELGATFLYSSGRNQFDLSGAAFDDNQDATVAGYRVYSRNRFAPRWQSTLRLGRGVDDSTSHSAFGTSRFENRDDQLAWQNEVSTPVGDTLLAAEDSEQEARTTDYGVRKRSIRSLLAGHTGRWGRHTLQGNVRWDDNSAFGDKTTGAIGYGYGFADGWRASIAYGTAFRVPTFNELFFPDFGNPELHPESSRQAEAAIRYDQRGHSASMVAYRNRVRDLIVLVGIPGTSLVQPENIDAAEITGVTFTYALTVAPWAVRASVDFIDPRNATRDNLLPRRAKHHGALNVTHSVGAWLVGTELIASGPRFDDTANTERMGGYALVNLFGEYRLDRAWTILGRINNLFDKEYELARMFATPGFNAFLGIRYE